MALIVNMLLLQKPKNIAARLDAFADNFDELLSWLGEPQFL